MSLAFSQKMLHYNGARMVRMKPQEAFGRTAEGKNHHRDKEKQAAYWKAWYATNREKVSIQKKAYRIAHLEKALARCKNYKDTHLEEIRAQQKVYHAAHRKQKAAHRKARMYGISQAEFDTLLLNQGGVCAICGTNKWNKNGPTIDHDHKTGKVRGILCQPCNSALGYIQDNPKTAQAMAVYLKKN